MINGMIPTSQVVVTDTETGQTYGSPGAAQMAGVPVDRISMGGIPTQSPSQGMFNQGLLYNNPNAFQQGMFMPQFMPMYQPQPTDGISSAVSQISGGMGDEYTNSLLSALGMGDVSQYQMQQPMMNPYAGMLSGYGMTAQPQFDPYALPTSPQANPFGGYTDYTGVNQDFINVRNNLITEISQRTGRSPTEALELINRTGILDGIITGMGGSRYGESSTTVGAPGNTGFGATSLDAAGGQYD